FFSNGAPNKRDDLRAAAYPSHPGASGCFHRNGSANLIDRSSSHPPGRGPAIKLGPLFIALLTLAIGAGLGSTMPAAQTMIQWAAGDKRLGVGTALVSFSRSIGGVMGAALASAVLLGALQVLDPNARNILSRELASIGLSHEASQIAPALIAAYRWVFLALGGLSACAAGVAWSIPDLDLAASPAKSLVTHSRNSACDYTSQEENRNESC